MLALQTGYLMLSMGDVAGAELMFDRAAGRPQVCAAAATLLGFQSQAHCLEADPNVVDFARCAKQVWSSDGWLQG